jgi:hypothetical protein
MIRGLATLGAIVALSIPLAADVTVTSVVSMQAGGPAGAAMGNMAPRMTMRIKGLKARADIDINGQTMSSITDLAAKQMILLRADQKTAQVLSADSMRGANAPPVAMPKIDASSKPTGRSQTINGVPCDEYEVAVKINMSEMSGSPQMPAEAAAMMKGVLMVMSGSTWVAKSGPGVADYASFQKAASEANMAAVMGLGNAVPGMGGGGFDRLMSTFSGGNGLPYLTEMDMSFEGTGPMVEMMKQIGAMKMTNKVTEVSTAALADDLFAVPADYKVVKQ